jgi:hypothetical protein
MNIVVTISFEENYTVYYSESQYVRAFLMSGNMIIGYNNINIIYSFE